MYVPSREYVHKSYGQGHTHNNACINTRTNTMMLNRGADGGGGACYIFPGVHGRFRLSCAHMQCVQSCVAVAVSSAEDFMYSVYAMRISSYSQLRAEAYACTGTHPCAHTHTIYSIRPYAESGRGSAMHSCANCHESWSRCA